MVLGLHQIMQACVALPAPPGAIWHNPGVPHCSSPYSVAHDYFFSGHTAIAVLGACELGRFGRRWVTAGGVMIVCFEVVVVLVLRAHYTMDVFRVSSQDSTPRTWQNASQPSPGIEVSGCGNFGGFGAAR
jgi:hypothetical protein